MPLSEHEQRLLDELEASLSADDPRLATVLRGTQPLRLRPRRAGFAAGGFVVTSGTFTEEAWKYAEGRSIELISSNHMLRLIMETIPAQ